MKTTILTIATILTATLAITTSCNSGAEKVEAAKEKQESAEEDLARANAEYDQEVANYKLTTQERIDANNKSIIEFKARVALQKKEVQADYYKKIEELEQKNTDAQKRLSEFKHNSRDSWESFKREFSHDMDELGTSLKDLTTDNAK